MTRAVLERKTRAELLQLAKRAGLRGISLLKKAALVEALLHTAQAPSLRRHAKKKRAPSRATTASAPKQRPVPVKPKRPSPAKAQPARPAQAPAQAQAAKSTPPASAPSAKAQRKPRRSALFQKKQAPKPKPAPAPAAAPPVRPVAKTTTAPARPVPAAAQDFVARTLPPLTELPAEYGKTGLVLMEIDPRHLHVYWEITAAERTAALHKLGPAAADSSWILRFYDTTFIHFDGQNAHSHFDVPIDLNVGNWYLELWAGEKTYCAEIGPLGRDGRFVPVARSNFVQVPRGEQASEYRPEWTKLEHVAGEKPQQPAGPPPACAPVAPSASPAMAEAVAAAEPVVAATPPTTAEPKELTEAKVRRHYEDMATAAVEVPSHPPKQPTTLELPAGAVAAVGGQAGSQPAAVGRGPSSADSSSFGLGSGGGQFPPLQPAVDLQLNAEIVVSGRAQPGQSVQINGRWIKVNADGSFSVRLALPVLRD